MTPQARFRIPLVYYLVDMIGTVFIGLGAWVLVTDDDIPVLEGFDRTMAGVGLVSVGFLLMLPFVAVLILTIKRNRAAGQEGSSP